MSARLGFTPHPQPKAMEDSPPEPASNALPETVALALWHRFAPEHHTEWADETHRAEYLDAADAVLALARPPEAPDGEVRLRHPLTGDDHVLSTETGRTLRVESPACGRTGADRGRTAVKLPIKSSDHETSETRTVNAVMKAAEAAFCPLSGDPSKVETIKTCAALVAFLKFAEEGEPRSITEWRAAIENLRLMLGDRLTPPAGAQP